MSDQKRNINNFDQNFKNGFEGEEITPPDFAWDNISSKFPEIEDEIFDATIKNKLSSGIQPPNFLWKEINKSTDKDSRKIRVLYWILLCLFIAVLGTFIGLKVVSKSEVLVERRSVSDIHIKETETGKLVEKVQKEELNLSTVKESKNFGEVLPILSSTFKSIDSIKNEENKVAKDLEESGDEVKQLINSTVLEEDEKLKEPNLSENQDTDLLRGKENILFKDGEGDLVNNLEETLGNEQDIITLNEVLKESNNFEGDKLLNQNETQIDVIDSLTSLPKDEIISRLNNEILPDSIDNSLDSISNYVYTDSVNELSLTVDSNSFKNKTSKGTNKKKKKQNKQKIDSMKKWMVTGYFVRGYYSHLSSIENQQNHLYDSLLIGGFKSSIKLGFQYNLTSSLQVGVGVGMNKFKYDLYNRLLPNQLNFDNHPLSANNQTNQLIVESFLGNAQTDDLEQLGMVSTLTGMTLDEFATKSGVKYSERTEYQVINIPVDITWTPGKSKVKPMIVMGGDLKFTMNVSSSIDIEWTDAIIDVPVSSTSITNYAQLNKLSFNGYTGVGAQFEITDRFGIRVLPTINYQFNNLSKDSKYVTTPYSLRVNSGLFFKI